MKTEQHGQRYMRENRTVVVALRMIELHHEIAQADKGDRIGIFPQSRVLTVILLSPGWDGMGGVSEVKWPSAMSGLLFPPCCVAWLSSLGAPPGIGIAVMPQVAPRLSWLASNY